MVKVRRSRDQWTELDQADSRLDWSRQEHMDHRDKRMAGAPCHGKHNQDLPGCRVRNQHCVTYTCGVCQIRTLYVPAVTATGGTRKATPLEHVQQGPPMPPPQTRRTKAAAATSSSSAAATKPTPRPTPAPAPRQTPATEQEEETPVHLPIWEPNGCQGQAAAPADGDEYDAETPGLTPASPNDTRIRDCPCGKWRSHWEDQCECGSRIFYPRESWEPCPEGFVRSIVANDTDTETSWGSCTSSNPWEEGAPSKEQCKTRAAEEWGG